MVNRVENEVNARPGPPSLSRPGTGRAHGDAIAPGRARARAMSGPTMERPRPADGSTRPGRVGRGDYGEPMPADPAFRDLVDVEALTRWLDQQGFPGGPVEDLAALEGGTQNLLVRFVRGGTAYVLRRPSRHPRPRASQIILREARVLEALAATDVPHPRWAATCADESVLGIPFVVMRAVDGVNPMVAAPAYAGDAAGRRELGRGAAAELARIGCVDYVGLGLGDLGRPDGFLGRQVPRWLGEWDSYRHLPGLAEYQHVTMRTAAPREPDAA